MTAGYYSLPCALAYRVWTNVLGNANIVRIYISRLFNILIFGKKHFSGQDTYYDTKNTSTPRSAPKNFIIGARRNGMVFGPP